MAIFDYDAGAGLYPCKDRRNVTRLRYRRFDTAAEALRFAIEDMPPALLRGSILEVNETRFDGAEMRRLYDAGDYPLPRKQ